MEFISLPHDMRGARIIEGIASSSAPNSHGYAMAAKGCFARLPVPVLWKHDWNHQIGEVTALWKHDDHIGVRAEIFRTPAADEAWKEIIAGRAVSFSGAAANGSLKRPQKMQKFDLYHEWTLGEVSVCFAGANPDSHNSIRVVRNELRAAASITLPARKPGVVYLR